jgi:hypothetical protein
MRWKGKHANEPSFTLFLLFLLIKLFFLKEKFGYHPPQKGPTNAGTGAVRFEFTSSQFDVASRGKLTTTWGKLKSR